MAIRVSLVEETYWDAESSHTEEYGTGDHRSTRTVYDHTVRSSNTVLHSALINVSSLPHSLAPGEYRYPFTYQLPKELPGCLKFARSDESRDPAWRGTGRRLQTRASVAFVMEACLQSRECRRRREGGGDQRCRG